jgi:hypothetical protein
MVMRYADTGNGEGKVVPIHSMKCMGEWRSWVVSFNFQAHNFPYPQSRRLGGPQSIWMGWRKNLTPSKTQDQFLCCPSHYTDYTTHLPPPPPQKNFVFRRLWESLKCTMLVAVTHAGHTLRSLKSKVSALRFVPTIMLFIYMRCFPGTAHSMCTPCPHLLNIILYCHLMHVNHCNQDVMLAPHPLLVQRSKIE